jgi:hypothetical protein
MARIMARRAAARNVDAAPTSQGQGVAAKDEASDDGSVMVGGCALQGGAPGPMSWKNLVGGL